MMGLALFERSFELVFSMQVENVGDDGIVGCVVLNFKPSALVWWSAENSKVSVTQFEKRESADIHQLQGPSILAYRCEPKLAVSPIVIFEVFDGRMCRVEANILGGVVYSLARVFDSQTKVRDVVLVFILIVFNDIGSFDRTSHWMPSRIVVCIYAADI